MSESLLYAANTIKWTNPPPVWILSLTVDSFLLWFYAPCGQTKTKYAGHLSSSSCFLPLFQLWAPNWWPTCWYAIRWGRSKTPCCWTSRTWPKTGTTALRRLSNSSSLELCWTARQLQLSRQVFSWPTHTCVVFKVADGTLSGFLDSWDETFQEPERKFHNVKLSLQFCLGPFAMKGEEFVTYTTVSQQGLSGHFSCVSVCPCFWRIFVRSY